MIQQNKINNIRQTLQVWKWAEPAPNKNPEESESGLKAFPTSEKEPKLQIPKQGVMGSTENPMECN